MTFPTFLSLYQSQFPSPLPSKKLRTERTRCTGPSVSGARSSSEDGEAGRRVPARAGSCRPSGSALGLGGVWRAPLAAQNSCLGTPRALQSVSVRHEAHGPNATNRSSGNELRQVSMSMSKALFKGCQTWKANKSRCFQATAVPGAEAPVTCMTHVLLLSEGGLF